MKDGILEAGDKVKMKVTGKDANISFADNIALILKVLEKDSYAIEIIDGAMKGHAPNWHTGPGSSWDYELLSEWDI